MEHVIVILIIGGVAGWLASILMKTRAQMGVLANIVVGIAGSVLGTWIAHALGLGVRSYVGSWVVAIAGAMTLIAILKALRVYR